MVFDMDPLSAIGLDGFTGNSYNSPATSLVWI